MKKFMIFLVMLVMSMAGTTCFAEIVRTGNTFSVEQTAQADVQTPYTWKDKDGKTYPIFITRKGACYVKRISKKTGKEYKYYLPKEVQEAVKKEVKYITVHIEKLSYSDEKKISQYYNLTGSRILRFYMGFVDRSVNNSL